MTIVFTILSSLWLTIFMSCGAGKPSNPGSHEQDGMGPVVSHEMVQIPSGGFVMGTTPEEEQWLKDTGWWKDWMKNEEPAHTVHLDAYYMDKYEVTNAQYGGFMKATGRSAPEYWNDSRFNPLDQPVIGVTWQDAEAYCKWAGRRLPTEAEWETAARGTDRRQFPWGNETPTCEYAVMCRELGHGCGKGRPWPVGSKPKGASPYGAYDMAGNVWEWVNDWYDNAYYSRSPNRNPTGSESGDHKVLRGGSWYNFDPRNLRAAFRDGYPPDSKSIFVGFRCAGSP